MLARRLTYLLVIMTLAGGSLLYCLSETGVLGASRGVKLLSGIAFALTAIIGMLLVGMMWRNYNRSLHFIRRQLHQFEQENRIGLIMIDVQNELADLVGDINKYLTRMGSCFADSRLVQKELKIQAGAAEAELKQMEAVICSITEAVVVTDRYDELLLANRAAEELLGINVKEDYRRPVQEILSDRELCSLIEETRLNRDLHESELLERLSHDGSRTLSLKAMFSCVMDSGDEPIGVVTVIHDMTAERELARLKDDFLSNVTHELKTPLASIRACAEMLIDNEASSEEAKKQMGAIIEDQSKRLNRLIDNILNISKIESGAAGVELRDVDLAAVLREAASAIEPQIRGKGLLLEKQIPEELWISADRDMLYQAVMNLLSNAVKYTPQGGSIRVRGWSDGSACVIVEVKDSGVGIPPQSVKKIFNKFYRVPEHREMSGGTGLGLNLVQQIIEVVHHGEISVESRYGEGSAFRFFIPIKAEVPAMR